MSSAPSFTAKCCDPGAVLQYEARGSETQLAGVACYVTGSSLHAVLYATDIFGFRFANTRHLADVIADAGFTVFIPDMFQDDPVTVQDAIAEGKAAVMRWAPKHRSDDTVPIIEAAAKALQDTGKYQDVQVIGFCYGAEHVARLLTTGAAVAGVITHASNVDAAFADSIHMPIQWNCASHDEFFSKEQQHAFEQKLHQRGVEADFIEDIASYPGTQHGFATRSGGRSWKDGEGEGADSNTEEQQKRLRQNIIAFLLRHRHTGH